jgi:hypothetical protein
MPAPKENTPSVQSVPSAVNVMRSPRRMLKVPVPMDHEDFRDRIYRMERELNAIIRANRAYIRQQRHSGKQRITHERRKLRAAEIRVELASLLGGA